MWHLSWANLRAYPTRFVATMLAIVVATGFLAATLVLRDSLGATLRGNATSQLAGVDAAVLPPEPALPGRGSGGPTTIGDQPRLPAALLATVQAAPGVGGAAGVLSGPVKVLRDTGEPVATGSEGRLWIPVAELDPFTLVAGRGPAAAGEVTLDRDLAHRAGVGLGAAVHLATAVGPRPAVVVGLTEFGDRPALDDGGDVLVAAADGFSWLGDGTPAYDEIYVAAAPGVDPHDLVDTVATAVGTQGRVESGDRLRADEASTAGALADILGVALQVFAYVALFVGCFIVYNTFSITVRQRLREFALLRAVGASTRQVSRAVRIEALLVGTFSSILGLAFGAGAFWLATLLVPPLRELAGRGGVTVQVGFWPAVQVIASGVAITLISAFVPAFRAARTKPIEALRASTVDRGGASRGRAVVGLVLLGLGVGGLLGGMALGFWPIVALGPALLFLGTVVGGPMLAAWFALGVGRLLGHRPTARLAVANSERNATRTATTANALIIGMFLVTFVVGAGGAVRDYAVRAISRLAGADLTISAESGTTLPPEIADRAADADGVAGVTPVYGLVGTTATGLEVGAVDPARAADVLGLTTTEGDLGSLERGGLAVSDGFARSSNLAIGDRTTVTLANGATLDATVTALTGFDLDLPPALLATPVALRADPSLRPDRLAVKAAPGATTRAQDSVDQVVEGYANLSVLSGNSLAIAVRELFDLLIRSVSVLLAVSIFIGLFGIVNTMLLAVTERTRELGLLRAVGMTNGQVRAMVTTEALIVSTLGTVIGVVMGLFVAWALTRPLVADEGAGLSWPVAWVGALVVAGALIGLVAALVPMWRATRLDVLDAIRDD